jgi:hypothetical protein
MRPSELRSRKAATQKMKPIDLEHQDREGLWQLALAAAKIWNFVLAVTFARQKQRTVSRCDIGEGTPCERGER